MDSSHKRLWLLWVPPLASFVAWFWWAMLCHAMAHAHWITPQQAYIWINTWASWSLITLPVLIALAIFALRQDRPKEDDFD